jgi:hypothetical protein
MKHETRHVPTTQTDPLILFRERVAVDCETQTEHTTTLCGAYYWVLVF